jgi:hypothetical protein
VASPASYSTGLRVRRGLLANGLLALSGGIVTSVIAAAIGAAVVLFGWRMAK